MNKALTVYRLPLPLRHSNNDRKVRVSGSRFSIWTISSLSCSIQLFVTALWLGTRDCCDVWIVCILRVCAAAIDEAAGSAFTDLMTELLDVVWGGGSCAPKRRLTSRSFRSREIVLCFILLIWCDSRVSFLLCLYFINFEQIFSKTNFKKISYVQRK